MSACYTCGGGMGKHDPVAHDQVPEEPMPPPCLNCGCPWNSCLIHTEFCCDACAHFEPIGDYCSACGHPLDRHGPEAGGCIECRCVAGRG